MSIVDCPTRFSFSLFVSDINLSEFDRLSSVLALEALISFIMAPSLVDNAQIKHAELLQPLSLHFHAYIWPFVIVWPVFLRYFLTPDLYEKHIGAPEWTFVWVGSIITVQSLVWLSTHWSVDVAARFTAKKVNSINDAQLIKVTPIANAGSAEICKLIRDKVRRFLFVLGIKQYPTPN